MRLFQILCGKALPIYFIRCQRSNLYIYSHCKILLGISVLNLIRSLLKLSLLLQEAMTAGASGSQGPLSEQERERNYEELVVERSRVEK